MINRKLFYQRTNETQHYQNEIAARDRTLNEIYRSRGWKVLTNIDKAETSFLAGYKPLRELLSL